MLMKYSGFAQVVELTDLINTHGLFVRAHNGTIAIGERTQSGGFPMYYSALEVHKDVDGKQVIWCPDSDKNSPLHILQKRKVPMVRHMVEVGGDQIIFVKGES